MVRRYNVEGPEAMHNRRYTHSHRAQPLLSAEQLAELAVAVRGPAPEGEYWIGRTVAAWMSERLGRPSQRVSGLGLSGAPRRQAAQAPPTPCAGGSR